MLTSLGSMIRKSNQSKSTGANNRPRSGFAVRKTGTLAVISGLLLGSAVIRIGIGTTEAIAATGSADEDIFATDSAQTSGNTHNSTLDRPIACVTDEDIGPLLTALQEREALVEEQETDLQFRMKTLATAKIEVEERLAALVAAEEKLSATIAKAATAAEDDLSQLTTVYEQMKPRQAAALFEEMDPEFAAGFLGRMRAEAASSILAGMTPNAAYSISVILAGRNADTPTE